MSDNLKDFILRVKKDRFNPRLRRSDTNEDINKLYSFDTKPKSTLLTISSTTDDGTDLFRSFTFRQQSPALLSKNIDNNNELPIENQNDILNQFSLQPDSISLPVRSANNEQKKEAVDSIVDDIDTPNSAASPFVYTPEPYKGHEGGGYLGQDQDEPDQPDKDYDKSGGGHTTDDSKVLKEILKDIEGLMEWKNEGKKRDNMICSIDGTWISEIGGVNLVITPRTATATATSKSFNIQIEDKMPPGESGFLCSGNWSLAGEMPFNNSGVIVILAKHEKDKHLATFIGECRVCDAAETVTGTWLLGRTSRDCKDEKASHQVLSDVWKRENIKELQTKHLRAINANTKT